MHERALYAAHPINTYGTPLVAAYLRYLSQSFPQASEIIDPASDAVKREVERIKQEFSRDPTSGEFSQKLYNEVGAKKVMEYFAHLVRVTAGAGAGLAIPINSRKVQSSYFIPAGIAKELRTIFANGPIWVVVAYAGLRVPHFERYSIAQIRLNTVQTYVCSQQSKKDGEPEELFDFVAETGEVFEQLSVASTRARIYTQLSGGGWDRNTLKPYFIE